MKPSQVKIRNASKRITVILKLGFIVSNIVVMLGLAAIGILMFSGKDIKSSFLAAFEVTMNNGTTIGLAPQSLFIMFTFAVINELFISAIIFIIYKIFDDIKKGNTPFLHRNAARVKIIAIIVIVLSLAGSHSDGLVDYYTIGRMTWRMDIIGVIIGMVIYCISLIFRYGCDLQQESDETL